MSLERIEIVRSTERLAEVGPAWMDLWCRAGALVFQSHAWIDAWWRTAPDRDRRALQVVLAWNGDRLDAVLPLATCRRRGLRLLEWAAKDHTDYGDALVAPGLDGGLLRRMWAHLSAAGGFDLIYLNRLLPDAKARTLLGPAGTAGVRLRPNRRSEVSFRVAGAWPTGDAWVAAQSKKTRQNYRRGQKFIGDAGVLRFRLLPPEEPMAPVLARLAELKRAWLAGHDLESNLYDEGALALAALVRVLAETGLLRAFVLECDGVIVAVSINFVQAGTMMAFVTTYDPAFERGSPGMVLMMDYIRWSIDRGLHTVDFLCGAEAFKSRFATTSVTLDSVMGRRTLPGAAAMMLDSWNLAVRGMRRRGAAASPPTGASEAA
ncbi:GNAT family N-acetyltransferase [uncultured Methylobacterium sp.]|uniref:GNAT family N-acetyltransferase n=1 Tax=uncultured Methylobacterium sp. TaxID=157278 RepID=UPI0035CB7DAB